MMAPAPAPDWAAWLRRWDRQQEVYLPEREERFAIMLDVVDALLAETFVALDLACGPGSLSHRLLSRFAHATCLAVDLDPVLLALGQGALGDMQGRLRWIDADLRDPGWPARLDCAPVDAVLSTTALHWLPPDVLVRLYQQLGTLVRPGGLVLNGDHFPFGLQQPAFAPLVERMQSRRAAGAPRAADAEDWPAWWAALAHEPGLAPLFAERERRFAWRAGAEHEALLDLHEAALRNAGFREVGTIWQHGNNRVLLAIR